ncbi:hypothetical protein F2Q69_00018012 [Brassica cretica]|uniref:Uncharacterized protein n=1 Tax=Brassica cretica TaxID=69181 RepID=A0A8S9QUA2_BRACR|nr:hypothetical protein F2Q69_00018012 [Brassica cretica]
MLRVDAKQGTPKDGNHLELFHVEIYPLRIHLSETMYKMMWEYFFPEEEQNSERRHVRTSITRSSPMNYSIFHSITSLKNREGIKTPSFSFTGFCV